MAAKQNQKATDSPWFWVYLFSTFALIALVLIQSKFSQRQSLIERKWQATRMINNQQVTEESKRELSDVKSLQTNSITALILILGITTVVGWIVFWRSRFRVVPDIDSSEICEVKSNSSEID